MTTIGRQFVVAYLRQCADEELVAAESTSLLEPGGKGVVLAHYRAACAYRSAARALLDGPAAVALCALHSESDDGGGMGGSQT